MEPEGLAQGSVEATESRVPGRSELALLVRAPVARLRDAPWAIQHLQEKGELPARSAPTTVGAAKLLEGPHPLLAADNDEHALDARSVSDDAELIPRSWENPGLRLPAWRFLSFLNALLPGERRFLTGFDRLVRGTAELGDYRRRFPDNRLDNRLGFVRSRWLVRRRAARGHGRLHRRSRKTVQDAVAAPEQLSLGIRPFEDAALGVAREVDRFPGEPVHVVREHHVQIRSDDVSDDGGSAGEHGCHPDERRGSTHAPDGVLTPALPLAVDDPEVEDRPERYRRPEQAGRTKCPAETRKDSL